MTINSSIVGTHRIVQDRPWSGFVLAESVNNYSVTHEPQRGSGSVTQNGNSVLNVSNANNSTFTGGLFINAGQVQFQYADNNLGAPSSGITLTNNAILNDVATTGVITDTHVITLFGSGGEPST